MSVKAVAQVTVGEWALMLGLIFGGCCSNVFTLEKIINEEPDSGNIVTFAQFLFIAVEGYIRFWDSSRPPLFIRKNEVPLKRWSLSILMFFTISLLNNSVFKFNISMPIHIVFRSSGTAIVMIIGWLCAGKKYTKIQVVSAVLLSAGAIITTLFKEVEVWDVYGSFMESSGGGGGLAVDSRFLVGIGMLFVGAVLMALLGLHNEETYRVYGKHNWRENIFYSHLFGIPLFMSMLPTIIKEFKTLWNSPDQFAVVHGKLHVAKPVVYLLLNVLTQFFCVRGVNMLGGSSTALTVSVILLLRKFTSLLLSVYIFSNKLSMTGTMGALLVFLGALLYSYGSTIGGKKDVTAAKKEK